MNIFKSLGNGAGALFKKLEGHERVQITILAVIIGVVSGYGAILLRVLIEVVATTQVGTTDNILATFSSYQWWQRMIPPLIGLSIVVPVIHYLARETAGSGIPQVMESIAIRGGYIRPRVGFIKLVVTALTLGSGGSAGYEGPIVQIGSSGGSLLGQLTKASYRRMRILLASGASAGIAATFNAPIAGVLFSLEVLVGEYSTMTLSPLVIASVMGTVISRAHLGDNPSIVIPDELHSFGFASGFEIGTFLLLGLVTGALGVIFSRSLFGITDFFRAIKVPVWLKGVIGAVMVAIFVAIVPNVAGNGYETIDGLFRGDIGSVTPENSLLSIIRNPIAVIFILFIAKLVATSVTIGMGTSGGIFAPSLFLGATSGYFVGQVLRFVMPGYVNSPGYYSLVGMGALLAGATHTPMTSIIIIFEMTGDYKIILPLMLACMFSTLVASRLDSESIFTRQLARKGINVRAGREEQVMAGIKVGEIMERDFDVIPHTMRYGEILKFLASSRGIYFPVVDRENRMLGLVRYYDLRSHFFDKDLENLVIAHDLMVSDVESLTPEDTLLSAFEKFNVKEIEQMPVVDSDNERHVVGMLSRRDLINAYNKAVLRKGLDVDAPHEEEIHS